jgi:hypothetical protein
MIVVGSFSWTFRLFYGCLVYFVVILVYFHVLVCCAKENLATLIPAIFFVWELGFGGRKGRRDFVKQCLPNKASPEYNVANRVTRLGEFSPLWLLFTLASLMKVTELAHIFGQLFSSVKVLY